MRSCAYHKPLMPVQKVMGDMAASIPLAMSVDTGAFQNAFQMKMTEEELTELIMSLMTNGTRSFDANLSNGKRLRAQAASGDVRQQLWRFYRPANFYQPFRRTA